MCRIWYSTVLKNDKPLDAYGPAKLKRLGKYGDRHPLVGLEAAVAPPLSEVAGVAADDLDRGDVGLPQIEAGGQHQRVDLRLGAVGRDDAVRLDPLDAGRLQMHVRLGESPVVRVGVRGPLTSEVVVRREFAPESCVSNGDEPPESWTGSKLPYSVAGSTGNSVPRGSSSPSRFASVTQRKARWISGTRANRRLMNTGIGKSTLGTTWIGVRW